MVSIICDNNPSKSALGRGFVWLILQINPTELTMEILVLSTVYSYGFVTILVRENDLNIYILNILIIFVNYKSEAVGGR